MHQICDVGPPADESRRRSRYAAEPDVRVALSCDCGDRAAGRYRWQYSGAHRCEPPLRVWLTVGSARRDRRAAALRAARPAGGAPTNSVVVHSHTLPIMSTRPNPFGGNVPDRRRAHPAQRAVVAVREPALPGVGHQLAVGRRRRRPTGRSWCCRRAPRTPTPPRSAAAGPPTARRPPRRDRRPARPDGPAGRRSPSCRRGPNGCRQHAPGAQSHHCRQSRRSTGPAVGRNTSAPGTRSAGSTPGYSAGSSGCSATVT